MNRALKYNYCEPSAMLWMFSAPANTEDLVVTVVSRVQTMKTKNCPERWQATSHDVANMMSDFETAARLPLFQVCRIPQSRMPPVRCYRSGNRIPMPFSNLSFYLHPAEILRILFRRPNRRRRRGAQWRRCDDCVHGRPTHATCCTHRL